MSDIQPDDFDKWIDWSNVNLLDACYDLMPQGMDLSGVPQGNSFDATRNGIGLQESTPNEDALDLWQAVSVGGLDQDIKNLKFASLNNVAPLIESTITNDIWSTYPCHECGEKFDDDWAKLRHARNIGHLVYKCQHVGCDKAFVASRECNAHQRTPHVAGHGRIGASNLFDCIACNQSLRSKADLLRHAKEFQHQPYGCECGITFSRLDVLNRHLESFATDDPKFPCKYCKLHRGPQGFRRLDHLMQHVRNYHHHDMDKTPVDGSKSNMASRLKYYFPTCSHPECPQYRDETFMQLPRSLQAQSKPFGTQSAYTKHMREEHNECSFPCNVVGCDRVGRRGYFREKDLLKHRREQHPDAPLYQVTKREMRVQCTEVGCTKILDPSSISWHLGTHRFDQLER